MVKYFECFYVYFYGNYFVYFRVYIVMSDYLYVYIVMLNHLHLFLINCDYILYYMLKALKKTNK